MFKQTPPPPADLLEDGRAFWASVTFEFSLEAHHLAVLHMAAAQLDRSSEARALLAAQGLFTQGRGGTIKEHPAASTERAAMRMFRSLVRELGLDIEPEDSGYSRPPRLEQFGRERN